MDKLNDKEPNSDLLYGRRLKLAFKSYFKNMSILSVLAGFSLMVVSFTIYTSLAWKKEKKKKRKKDKDI